MTVGLVACAQGAPELHGNLDVPADSAVSAQDSGFAQPSNVSDHALLSADYAATDSVPAAHAPAAPEPKVEALEQPVLTCKYALDLVSFDATHEGWTATMSWDASAGRYSSQLDALDLARVVWSVVETWKGSPLYAADREAAVRENLAHVTGVVADQETVDHALGARKVPGFSSDELGTCVGASHGYMVADRAATNPYPHAHEVTHGLLQAVFGDADPHHTRVDIWGAEGLAVNATKLFRTIPRTEARVSPR